MLICAYFIGESLNPIWTTPATIDDIDSMHVYTRFINRFPIGPDEILAFANMPAGHIFK